VPISRKKKKKISELSRLKNSIRGASDKWEALKAAADFTPPHLLSYLAGWSTRWLKYNELKSLEPTTLRDLHSVPFPTQTDSFHREFSWVVALLNAKVELLKDFVILKYQFEQAILSADLAEVENALDRIETRIGPSLWNISSRIAVLQLCKGIETQKEFVGRDDIRAARHIVRFFAFWWSVRAEDNTSAERFLGQIARYIQRWHVPPVLGNYINYQLRSSFPTVDSEAALLANARSTNIIDLFQMFGDLAAASVAEDRPASIYFAEAAGQLARLTGDTRLEKVALLRGMDMALSNSLPTSLVYQDAELAECPLSDNRNPSSLEEIAACQTPLTNSPPLNPIIGRIRSTLADIRQPGATGTRAAAELLKIGLMLDKLNIGQWCIAKSLEVTSPSLISDLGFGRLRFLATPNLEPFAIPLIPGPAQQKYVEQIVQVYGSRPSVTVARVLAGLAPIPDSSSEELGPSKLEELRIFSSLTNGDYDSALHLARAAISRLKVPTKLLLRTEILCQIELGRVEDALRSVVSWCLQDTRLAVWAPLEEVHTAVEATSGLNHLVEKPILYDLLTRHRDISFASLKSYACEDYLASLGLERPSQIDINRPPTAKDLLVYFLSEVCTAPVLRLSIAYASEHELEDELITISQMLAKVDSDNAEKYEENAREIVRARSIRQALQELQRSKVSIDEDALRVWCGRNLREDYDRYIALLRSGVAVLDENYQKELLKAVSAGELPESLFDVPVNEASALFAKLVTRIMYECLFNTEHGLDCYLSLRVRHGTLSGQLRSSVEQEQIVTRRDASSGAYQRNQHWAQALAAECSPYEVSAVGARLAEFSKQYDSLLSDVTDRLIQVKRAEKPDGLFDLKLPELSVYSLATEVKSTTPFDDFLTLCFDLFWGLLESNLVSVRSYIDTELRASIRDRFDELERDIGALSSAPAVGRLADAIRRARTEVGFRLDAMRDWFVEPTPSSAVQFALSELIDISLATIKSFHPNFDPRLSLDITELPKLRGALRLFSDIMFVLFENIILYSGYPVRPSICIKAWVHNQKLWVSVENDIAPGTDVEQNLARIDAARTIIESGAYLSAVRHEGGTGLPKLAKLIRGSDQRPALEFVLDREKMIFFVKFGVQITEIEIPAGRDHEAIVG